MSDLDPFEHDDAAYVLGILDDDERIAFERHLRACEACTDRVARLAPLERHLGGLTPVDIASLARPVAVPDTLLAGLLRRAGTARRRRRAVTAGLTGLTAACAVLAAVALWPSHPAPSPPTAGRPQAMAPLVATPLEATAAVVDTSWGTRISLDCRYGGPQSYPADPLTYSLTVVDATGVHHQLGSWTVRAGAPTEFTSGTALHRAQIRAIDITRSDGTPVLALVE